MGVELRAPERSEAGAQDHRRQLAVFRAAQRQWTVGDVLAIAPRVLGERTTESPAAGRLATRAQIDDAAVDAAVQSFRYAHNLVSAQECMTWLAARALSFADLRASMHRRLSGAAPATPATAEIDLMLSDDFRVLARALAARVAAALEANPVVDGGALQWAHIDASYRAHLGSTITDEVRERYIAQDRRQWLQVDCEVVEFDRIDAAREARHCAAEDGQSLAEIAALGGFAHRSGRWWVSELPVTWSQALFQIRPGMVSGVIPEGERQLLLGFNRLIEPNCADPVLAARLENALVEQQVRILLTRHVQWTLAGLD